MVPGSRWRAAASQWGAQPPQPGVPPNPRSAIVVRSAEEGRAAVREHIEKSVDHIKLYPGGAYSFSPTGEDLYQTQYPLDVLTAIIDETHKSGRKAGCHVYGGEGLQNAITAGCDTIEHGYGLRQPQLDEMAKKGIAYDVTFARYSSPYMDDNDAKNTGGKYRIVPIYERAMKMAIATPKLAVLFGTGVDGTYFPHGTNTIELEKLVKQGGMTTARAIQSATITNATAMGWQNEVGSIAAGKFADLAAVAGRSAGRHHRAAARALRDEGRQGHSSGPPGGERHPLTGLDRAPSPTPPVDGAGSSCPVSSRPSGSASRRVKISRRSPATSRTKPNDLHAARRLSEVGAALGRAAVAADQPRGRRDGDERALRRQIRVRVAVEARVPRPSHTPLDGTFLAWANPPEGAATGGDYPFAFDCPDAATHADLALPVTLTAQVAAFAQQVSLYESAEARTQRQGRQPPHASFIPSGLVSPSGEPVTPPEPHALIAGHVLEADTRANAVQRHAVRVGAGGQRRRHVRRGDRSRLLPDLPRPGKVLRDGSGCRADCSHPVRTSNPRAAGFSD